MSYVAGSIILVAAVFIMYRILIREVVIWEPKTALLYRNGKYLKRLSPGIYRLLRFGIAYSVKPVDTRLQILTLSGQELLTSDNAGIKVSMSIAYRIINPELAQTEVVEITEAIYLTVQLALRVAISKRSVENIVEQRDEIEREIAEAVAGKLELIGVEVQTAGIKDIMFPGDLKKIMNEIIKAKKEGQAALEKARGETAVLRNLANAARMLENNPNLMNLKVLQTIGEACGNTYVMGVTHGLFQAQNGNGNKE